MGKKKTAFVPCEKRILIADDQANIRALFETILKSELKNCQVDLAVDGAEVVSSFRHGHHKVIVMDIQMPRVDGERAYFEIVKICEQEKWERPAVIFCTGYDPPHDTHNIAAAESQNCILRKPLDARILVQAVKVRLEGRKPG